jgi:hypothetical protein
MPFFLKESCEAQGIVLCFNRNRLRILHVRSSNVQRSSSEFEAFSGPSKFEPVDQQAQAVVQVNCLHVFLSTVIYTVIGR